MSNYRSQLSEYHSMKNKKVKGSRRASYEKTMKPYLESVKELLYKGATNKEIAQMAGIPEITLYRWRKKYHEFDALFTDPILYEKLSSELYNALYDRALGKYVDEHNDTVVDGKVVTSYQSRRYIYSDKAAELYVRSVLGSKESENEITINFVGPDSKKLNIKLGSEDDEGDFEQSR